MLTLALEIMTIENTHSQPPALPEKRVFSKGTILAFKWLAVILVYFALFYFAACPWFSHETYSRGSSSGSGYSYSTYGIKPTILNVSLYGLFYPAIRVHSGLFAERYEIPFGGLAATVFLIVAIVLVVCRLKAPKRRIALIGLEYFTAAILIRTSLRSAYRLLIRNLPHLQEAYNDMRLSSMEGPPPLLMFLWAIAEAFARYKLLPVIILALIACLAILEIRLKPPRREVVRRSALAILVALAVGYLFALQTTLISMYDTVAGVGSILGEKHYDAKGIARPSVWWRDQLPVWSVKSHKRDAQRFKQSIESALSTGDGDRALREMSRMVNHLESLDVFEKGIFLDPWRTNDAVVFADWIQDITTQLHDLEEKGKAQRSKN